MAPIRPSTIAGGARAAARPPPVRTGGTRTMSLASNRCSGLARLPFTRTSPLRITRKMWLFGTSLRIRPRKLSSRWPAPRSSTSTCCTLAAARALRGAGCWRAAPQGIRNVLFSLRVSGYDSRRRRPQLVCDDAMPRQRQIATLNKTTSNAPHVSWSSITRPSLEGRLESSRRDARPKDASARTVGEVAQRVLALRPIMGRTYNVNTRPPHNSLWPHGMHLRVARLTAVPSVRISAVRIELARQKSLGSNSNEENARQCNSARGVARRAG